MTKEELKKILTFATDKNIDKFYEPLLETMAKFNINSPKRIAAFIAQLAHESGSLRYVEEIASGKAYEGRKDLGNTEVGDGIKFKGRGLIQLTGRANYKKAGEYFGEDFITHPELVETPLYATLIAGWFWNKHNLNTYADTKDFKKITKIINGGYNGLEDRLKHYKLACKVLGV